MQTNIQKPNQDSFNDIMDDIVENCLSRTVSTPVTDAYASQCIAEYSAVELTCEGKRVEVTYLPFYDSRLGGVRWKRIESLTS